MKADGLVELTNCMVCYGVSFTVFIAVNLYKHIVTGEHDDLSTISGRPVRQAESSISYVIAWLSTCLLVPLFSHSIFSEVYSMKGGVADATVTIIGFSWLFLLEIVVWIYLQWIIRVRSKWVYVIYFTAMTILYFVFIFIVFGALRSFEATHVLVFAFSIPLIFAMDASRRSNNYREQHEKEGRIPNTKGVVS